MKKTTQATQATINRFMELTDACFKIPVTAVIGSVGITIYRRPSAYPLSETEWQTAEGTFYAACPFHNGTPNGSFRVTRKGRENFWYCFKDGFTQANWSGVDFEMRYFGLWKEAWDFAPADNSRNEKQQARTDGVLHLSRRFGLITDEEYRTMAGRAYTGKDFACLDQQIQRPREYPHEEKRADADVMDLVYRAVAACCPLSVRHLQHLRKERGLTTEKDLQDYFTFPTRRMDLAGNVYVKISEVEAQKQYGKPLRRLNRDEITALEAAPMLVKIREQLPYVPGFYKDGQGRVTFMSQKGIGFLVRDDRGKAVGIQIRRDDVQASREALAIRDRLTDENVPEAADAVRNLIRTARECETPKEFVDQVQRAWPDAGTCPSPDRLQALFRAVKRDTTRYVWFSSAFALSMDGCTGGASSSSPGGVLYPDKVTDQTAVCITEGRFKAVQMAKHGTIAVYVSGVSSWKRIIPMLERLMPPRRTVYVMFDSDMMGNPAVYGSLAAMAGALTAHGWKPILGLWPIGDGKGFDDLVLGKGSDDFASHLTYIRYDEFAARRQRAYDAVMKKYMAATLREVHDMAGFVKDLQAAVEHACLRQNQADEKQKLQHG
jgi:hypothetical protein